jgi:hypothetical protein
VLAPWLDRARVFLKRGAGYDAGGENGGRQSAEDRVITFATGNRVNALTWSITRLPQFRERQDGVFRVLVGVGFS